jgi:hypothetical protein
MKARVIIGLLFFCRLAWADLLPLQDNNLATVYYEPPTFSGAKGIIPVWTVNNLKVNNDVGKSLRVLNEINCNTNEVRVIYTIRLSGEMGRGTLIRETKRVDEWGLISAGSAAEVLRNKVCF